MTWNAAKKAEVIRILNAPPVVEAPPPLAQALRFLRGDMTVAMLAGLSRYSKPTIGKIEKGIPCSSLDATYIHVYRTIFGFDDEVEKRLVASIPKEIPDWSEERASALRSILAAKPVEGAPPPLAQALAFLRGSIGVRRVAELSGYSRSTITRIEEGEPVALLNTEFIDAYQAVFGFDDGIKQLLCEKLPNSPRRVVASRQKEIGWNAEKEAEIRSILDTPAADGAAPPLANALRTLREQSGVTRDRLVDLWDNKYSKSTISNLERGIYGNALNEELIDSYRVVFGFGGDIRELLISHIPAHLQDIPDWSEPERAARLLGILTAAPVEGEQHPLLKALRALREESGRSRLEIEETLCISDTTLYRLEEGVSGAALSNELIDRYQGIFRFDDDVKEMMKSQIQAAQGMPRTHMTDSNANQILGPGEGMDGVS